MIKISIISYSLAFKKSASGKATLKMIRAKNLKGVGKMTLKRAFNKMNMKSMGKGALKSAMKAHPVGLGVETFETFKREKTQGAGGHM